MKDDKRVEALSSTKRALLEALMGQRGERVEPAEMLNLLQNAAYVSRPSTEAIPLDESSEKVLGGIVSEQAVRAPGAVAVQYQERTLTYGELARQSGRLAIELRRRGVDPGDRVILTMTQGIERIVALLAILRAGGVCVPLEVGSPPGQLSQLLRTLEPACVLLDAEGAEALRQAEAVEATSGTPAASRALEERRDLHWADVMHGCREADRRSSEESGWDLEGAVRPDSPAYIVYTSGSTGEPKGIVGTHRGVVHFCRWLTERFEIGPDDRLSQLAPLSFDASIQEIFASLISGARLVLLSDETRRDAARLLQRLLETRVTVCHLVPTVLRELMACARDRPREDQLGALRFLMVAGEVLKAHLVREWLERLPAGPRIVNLYGASEAALCSTFYEVVVPPTSGELDVPLGRPIPATEILLLDESDRPVVAGQIGEICIRTPYLALGYFRAPELTAERFVPNPVTSVEEDLVFRTGDLAVETRPGDLRYVGRKDLQYKIRGNRVELGEVEATLEAIQEIEAAAVTVQEGPDGTPALVAHYVGKQDLPAHSLRRHLSLHLRDYMIPVRYQRLDELPRTASGKIDRAHLPLVVMRIRPELNGEFVSPRTPVEQMLVAVWEEVLGLGPIGIRDDYFELGGQSILLMRLINRIAKATGVRLSFRDVFEAPTVEELSLKIEKDRAGLERSDSVSIPRMPEQDEYELSHVQHRLWFLKETLPLDFVFGVLAGVEIPRGTDRSVTEAVLLRLAERHEILRAVFLRRDGLVLQAIRNTIDVELEEASFADVGYDGDRLPDPVSEAIQRFHARSFDLESGPLWRALVLDLSNKTRLFLSIHHLIIDRWSFGLLLRQLSADLSAVDVEPKPPAAERCVRYVEFARWQNQRIESGVFAEAERYWSAKLAPPLPRLQLPDGTGAGGRGGGGRSDCRRHVDLEHLRALERLGRKHRCSLFITLLTGYLILLQRLSRSEDLIVGTPVAGRPTVELEQVVGPFVNLVPIRVHLQRDDTIAEVADRVRCEVLHALEYQEYPFDVLVSAVAPPRQSGRMPLTPWGFALQNTPELSSSAFDVGLTDLNSTEFELVVYAMETSTGLDLVIVSGGEPVPGQSRAEYVADEYVEVLQQLCTENWQCKVGQVRIREASSPWSQPRALGFDSSAELTLDDAFARQVRRTPAGLATVYQGSALTYKELDLQSARLAHLLREGGIAPGDRVALIMYQCIQRVTAFLGILKAGAVYLPLDVDVPSERLRALVEEFDPRWIIADGSGFERISQIVVDRSSRDRPISVLCFGGRKRLEEGPVGRGPRAWQEIDRYPSSRLEVERSPEDVAYIAYTSGSTGSPKGILGTHRGVVHFCYWQARQFDIGSGDRVSQLASIAFDASLQEMCVALFSGATLVLCSQRSRKDAGELARHLVEQEVTVCHLLPSLLNEVMKATRPSERRTLGCLRYMIVAGEALPVRLARQWIERFPDGPRLVNMYGTSETTLANTFYEVNSPPAEGDLSVSLGQPIPHCELLLVDGSGRAAPLGCPGEICIRTSYLTLGYWGRPEETQERFVPNPLGDDPADIVYRTGDLGVERSPGDLRFLGRLDDQVKIRGNRVKLAEIEAALESHPDVERGVATAQQVEDGQLVLVAFYVARGGQSIDAGAMRRHLGSLLRDYMIPVRCQRLDALPMTATGKLDRRALPKVDLTTRPAAGAPLEPRTETERALLAIWRTVLGLDELGVRDSFFLIGGHSLSAMRVANLARDRLQIDLSVSELFEAPTIQELATRVDARRGASGSGPSRPTIPRIPDQLAYETSYAQRRFWIISSSSQNSRAYGQISLSFEVDDDLDSLRLSGALEELCQRHEILRTVFLWKDGALCQRVLPGGGYELREVDFRNVGVPKDEEEVEALRSRPFDLEVGPLLRVLLIRLPESRTRLYLHLHHIITDRWSVDILLQDLKRIDAARRTGEEGPALPQLPVRYIDFAHWQKSLVESGQLAASEQYWRDQLGTLETWGVVPTDFPRCAGLEPRAGGVRFRLGRDVTEHLGRALSASRGTLSSALLTCYFVLLYKLSRSTDVTVGVTTAGRTLLCLEGVIGPFVNLLPIRAEIDEDSGLVDLMREIHDRVLEGAVHQAYPFDVLIQRLNPIRDMTRPSVLPWCFTFQNTPERQQDGTGWRLRTIEGEDYQTEFELALFVRQVDSDLEGTIVYDANLYDPATVERFCSYYQRIVELLNDQLQTEGLHPE